MKTLAVSFDRGAFVLECWNARVTLADNGEIVQFLAKNDKKPNMNDESVSTFLRAFMDKIAETFNEID